MWKRLGLVGLTTTLTIAATLALTGGTAMAGTKHTPPPRPYVCRGGDLASGNLTPIPSGNYVSITVTGACAVAPNAVINVGSVYVAPGATLDAQSAPSTITVRHDVFAGNGSFLGLGCQSPADTGNSGHACTVEPDGHSTISVYGSVTAFGADTVLLNGMTINGNVTLFGGGGEIPWAIKNNTIRQNLTIAGVTADWVGVLFNKIGLNATLLKITVTDTDPVPRVFVVQNTVRLNLICYGLEPGVSGGFAPGEVNVVGRHALGQCASLV
jgi:hypothetical protein